MSEIRVYWNGADERTLYFDFPLDWDNYELLCAADCALQMLQGHQGRADIILDLTGLTKLPSYSNAVLYLNRAFRELDGHYNQMVLVGHPLVTGMMMGMIQVMNPHIGKFCQSASSMMEAKARLAS